MKSVFKQPHNLFSSFLNERPFWIIQINLFYDNLGQDFINILWILNSNYSGGFLKVTLLWVLFWKFNSITFHYSICACLQPPDIDGIYFTVFAKRAEGLSKWTFVKINTFYNTIMQELTFSANQKLTSINSKVLKWSNFSTFQLTESKK